MNYSLLQLLNKTHSLKSVKSIHSHLILNNLLISSDLILNKLLRLYSRFGAIDYACKLFDVIPQPNPFLWTSLIHGFVENFKYTEAFNAFTRMHSGSVEPLNFTIASVLKGLSREKRLKEGEEIYGFVFKKGFGSDLIVQNAVLDFSMRCGKVDFARSLFDEMKEKDVVSWNTMVSGYGNNGRVDIAREFFNEMTERNVVSWTSIINVYVKSGNMVEARVLFDRMPNKDLASWNVMVSGYVNAGDPFSARFIFEEMPIHGVETWNLMILGFCKLGKVELANDYFNRMPKRNVASWTII